MSNHPHGNVAVMEPANGAWNRLEQGIHLLKAFVNIDNVPFDQMAHLDPPDVSGVGDPPGLDG